jgi:PAS domain S-box-containing protein
MEPATAQLTDPGEVEFALKTGQFVPWFQPLVTLRSAQLVGFEVLARWNHPDLGVLPADAFVPLAERNGWITYLMDAILEQALAATSVFTNLRLAINISPLQLRDPGLPEHIRKAAKKTGFSTDRLTIEVTETALVQNIQQARGIVENLKAMGCRLALDDFGTGYSSLCHLQSLPFDELKVDRTFVSSMTERRECRKIVAAVLGLGQSLDLTTVAEGIESQQQADMLLWLGCDIGQGWLYGPALPAGMLPAMISARREPAVSRADFAWEARSACSLQGLPAQRLAQLQAVYDGAPVGLSFIDRHERFININRRLAEMHGKPIEEHFGKTMAEVIPGIYPAVESYIHRALSGESIAELVITEPNSQGHPGRTFMASYQPARDEAGEVMGVSCALLDITSHEIAQQKPPRRKKSTGTLHAETRMVQTTTNSVPHKRSSKATS